ncbi:hypothetical protein ACFRQM_31090 [Streptomyces sp. NPDC056831]|uniref:hypothetical protein n=1 Tax=Streptomyces sp. NPDC056831 TaxID=3345954 RepID=UPI0036A40B9B
MEPDLPRHIGRRSHIYVPANTPQDGETPTPLPVVAPQESAARRRARLQEWLEDLPVILECFA